jgi:2-polyprenyl-6-methoxyphenol hydroxylase-like FAD-dependent oxidoreductase
MTDVLICGAGPAGAIAALVLARGRARVRLIDRARFPRKLCGDTLIPGALGILGRLGIGAVADGGGAPWPA